jgi:hypothetical protein
MQVERQSNYGCSGERVRNTQGTYLFFFQSNPEANGIFFDTVWFIRHSTVFKKNDHTALLSSRKVSNVRRITGWEASSKHLFCLFWVLGCMKR